MTNDVESIVCVHLYDDYSGSTNVFAQTIEALEKKGHVLAILTSNYGENGFIRRRWNVEEFPYRMLKNKSLALIFYAWSQFILFFKVLRLCLLRGYRTVYVSTVLPIGAVVAGRLARCRVVVHSHEVGLGTKALFRGNQFLVNHLANRVICVSEYTALAVGWAEKKTAVIHNSLNLLEWKEARRIGLRKLSRPTMRHAFTCVMACSPRIYKGIDSFLELAACYANEPSTGHPVLFQLILNGEPSDFERANGGQLVAENVSVIYRPPTVYKYYAEADLVMNLSHANLWVETFGLTLLEAMACAVPVICPVVGGCTEVVVSGEGGWLVDSRDIQGLQSVIDTLRSDKDRYRAACNAAYMRADLFSPDRFQSAIQDEFVGRMSI